MWHNVPWFMEHHLLTSVIFLHFVDLWGKSTQQSASLWIRKVLGLGICSVLQKQSYDLDLVHCASLSK